jgi:hypothetical protein
MSWWGKDGMKIDFSIAHKRIHRFSKIDYLIKLLVAKAEPLLKSTRAVIKQIC